VIAAAVGVLHASPSAANAPALLAGAVVQFLGNKHFAFRARGHAGRQAALFALVEVVTILLNGALYHAVVSRVTLGAGGAVIARAITTNVVFVLWSSPAWRRIFEPSAEPAEPVSV